ncbi:MAG: hypothetical protein ACYS74_07215 [Planctomycetota bacterium]|jgi:hypothetical protein
MPEGEPRLRRSSNALTVELPPVRLGFLNGQLSVAVGIGLGILPG